MEETRGETTVENKDSENDGHSRRSEKSASSMFCVKWNGFASQVREGLASLFGSQELVDVTLASSDGQRIRAHKIVLAMSSPFFRRILKDNPCKHPIVIISGIKFRHVEHVIRFIYMGEVRMREDEIEDFIDAAESLKIDGITSTVNHFDADILSEPESSTSTSPRAGVIRRTGTKSPVSPTEPGTPSPSKDSRGFLNVHDLKVPGYEEISPAVSPAAGRHHPNLNLSAAAWSPPYASGLMGSSPWSSSILQTQHHGHSHSHRHRSTEVLEIRTDSSSGDGSPGVIVELKDEGSGALNLSDSREQPVILPNRSLSEGDVNSRNSADSTGRRRVNSEEKGYELSMPELSIKSRESSPRSPVRVTESSIIPLHSPRSLQHAFPPQRTWQSEFGFPPPHTPHYLPLSLVAASAILSNHPPSRFLPVPQTSVSKSMTSSSGSMMPRYGPPTNALVTTSDTKSLSTSLEHVYRQQQSCDPRHLHHLHQRHHSSSSSSYGSNPTSKGPPSSLTTLRAKLTASMFAHGNSPHFHKSNSRASGLNITKPRSRTTTIRSSQVPQSARYTALEVDAMVERVDNFPGPLVPCTVCQKFVKRERLRAHIHECHLLKGETIVCPQCGIGLKSKGSFRVHIWRHKRGSLGVKKLRDNNLSS